MKMSGYTYVNHCKWNIKSGIWNRDANRFQFDYGCHHIWTIHPNWFREGMMVSVKGTLHLTDTGHVLRADDIKTGCPSKYESTVNE